MFFINAVILQILFIVIFKIITRKKKFRKYINIKLILLLCFVVFAVYVGSAIVIGYYLDQKLNSFDLNGDGVFSGEEITPEQINTMQAWTSDTGRNFAPIVAGIFYIINFIGLIIFAVTIDILVFNKIRRREQINTAEKNSSL